MKPIWEAETADGYTAKAVYHPDSGKYLVTVDTPKGSLTESFAAMYEPRFGIDVSDGARCQTIAELLLSKLEAKDEPEKS